jgi:hypothetical protein
MRYLVMGLVLAVGMTMAGSAVARADSISVTPASGNQYHTFAFHGSGFTQGDRLDIDFVSSDGDDFTYLLPDGDPAVLVIGKNGSFDLSIVPSIDLAGARAGMWQVQFCSEMTDDCYSGSIYISAS